MALYRFSTDCSDDGTQIGTHDASAKRITYFDQPSRVSSSMGRHDACFLPRSLYLTCPTHRSPKVGSYFLEGHRSAWMCHAVNEILQVQPPVRSGLKYWVLHTHFQWYPEVHPT